MERLSSLSAPAASLKEILNLDKAELVFQRLLEAVQAHSSELAAVRREVATKASSDDVCGMCREMQGRLIALEGRVAATEAAVTIPENSGGAGGDGGGGGGGGVTVGEAVQANGQALRAVVREMTEKAGKNELAAKAAELEACVRDRERAVRQWGVGRDWADSLGRAQRGLAGQLLAVEGVVATKLDRSELDNMEAACAKVSTVSDFLDDAATRVSTLEAKLDGEERERRTQDREMQEAVRGVKTALSGKADGLASKALAQDLVDLRTAFVEETNSGRRQLRTLKHGAGELKKVLDDLSSSSGVRLRDVEACLEGAATKEELALKADTRATEGSLRELRGDCSLRATRSSVSSLEATVSSLEREHAKTRKASDLTGRFVDWFTSRGQAYEHNIAAVEKHIENLATRSVDARARPVAGTGEGLRGAGVGSGVGGMSLFSSARGVSESRGSERRVPYGGSVRFTPT